MSSAPLPPDEAARLRALHELAILDTPPDERFDRIVRFIAEQLDAPIAVVSFVDSQRQWFKARVGTPVTETPRALAFCAHTILSSELLVVEDTLLDPRFADNPAVTGAPHLRFYAGAALSAPGGELIGSLCVLDNKPRQLAAVERSVLDALRRQVNLTLGGDPS